MSEPNLIDEWQVPCEFCGAQAGEHCDPSCVALSENWPVVVEPVDDEPQSTFEDDAKRAIMAQLYHFPMSGIRVASPPNWGDKDTDLWLAELAIWLAEYNKVIHAELDDLQGKARRMIGLQLEKDVIRRFLLGDLADGKVYK